MTGPLLVVDATNVLVRAAKAVERDQHPMTAPDGTPTGALLLFLNMLSRHVREEAPSRVVVCWDDPVREASWRRRLDPTYKQARSGHAASVPLLQAIDALTVMRGAGYSFHQSYREGCEADDRVADAVAQRDRPVVILSGDKDLLQLVYLDVVAVRPTMARGETDRWDARRVCEHYSIPTPADLAKVLAIMGDTSDGVVGLRGIGPKKAVKMLAAADWDLHAVLAGLGDEDDAQRVVTNYQLVRLPSLPYHDLVGVGDFHQPELVGEHSRQILDDFLNRYALRSVARRLADDVMWSPDRSAEVLVDLSGVLNDA